MLLELPSSTNVTILFFFIFFFKKTFFFGKLSFSFSVISFLPQLSEEYTYSRQKQTVLYDYTAAVTQKPHDATSKATETKTTAPITSKLPSVKLTEPSPTIPSSGKVITKYYLWKFN